MGSLNYNGFPWRIDSVPSFEADVIGLNHHFGQLLADLGFFQILMRDDLETRITLNCKRF